MKIWSVTMAFALASGLLLSGCTATTETKTERTVTPRMNQNVGPNLLPNSTKHSIQNVKKITNRLEKVAKTIPDVKQATAVVVGKTAIVGIDLNKNVDRAKADTIKYAVARALRKEPYGERAVVTSDADLGQRLLNVRNGVVNGRPISAFTNELGEIIGRLAPQLTQQAQPQVNPQPLPYKQR